MSNPTPGPWQWYNGCSWWRLGVAGDQMQHDAVICPVIDADGHPNLRVSPANKRLIGAAPELLDALKAIVDSQNYNDSSGLVVFGIRPADLDFARGAIARAERVTPDWQDNTRRLTDG